MSLRVVLEVGNRTKTHAADLGRQVDILPDDIRNFLQRWIIVQVGEGREEVRERERERERKKRRERERESGGREGQRLRGGREKEIGREEGYSL